MMNDYTAFEPARTCGGKEDGVFCGNVPLAMAYVKDQPWEKVMTARDALNCGTAFRSLVMPFRGEDGQ